MSYTISIWKQNILDTESPISLSHASEIFLFLDDEGECGVFVQKEIYSNLVADLETHFPCQNPETSLWSDNSLIQEAYTPCLNLGLRLSVATEEEIQHIWKIFARHDFVIYEPQGACVTLPNGTQFGIEGEA
jgi:hypothetical protein